MPTPSPSRLAILAVLVAALAGCSVLPKREPIQVYEPQRTPQQAQADWPSVDWALLVAKPAAGQQLDSERITVRPDAGAVQVYQAAAWSDPAPELLQTALVRGFQDSGRILAVARPGSGVHGDYSLQSDLRAFESVYEGGTPRAVIEIHARLVHPADGSVVAARTFREVEPAAGTEVPEVVAAFSRALDRVRGQVIGWTLVEGQRHRAKRAP